jgi:hypothetical protein
MPMQVVVTIYNSAGEVVKHLYSGSSQNFPNGFTLSSTAVAPGGSGVSLDLGGKIQGGGSTLTWLGSNDNGQSVSPGTYTIQVVQTDPFGGIKSWTQAVTVMPAAVTQSLDIYNSAGELVRQINTASISSLPLNDINLNNPSNSAYVVGTGAGVKFILHNTSGAQVPETWDGKSSTGQTVAPGTYIVQLVDNGPAHSVVMSKSFTVLDGAGAPSFDVIAGPNPVGPADKELVFSLNGIQAGEFASVELYNVAGELIASGSGSLGNNRVAMKVEGNWSSGIYVAIINANQGIIVISRKIYKIAVDR